MKTILFALALCCAPACGNREAPSTTHSTSTSSSARASDTAYAQDRSSPAAKASENRTKPVEKPKAADGPNAPDVPQDKADLALAQDVRRVIDEDETLSLAAKTVSAVAHGGTVTLKGIVPSEADKEQVEACVAKVPGVQHVDNQITLKPS
jgi:osmotically-inducible protein OsmY